MVVVERRGIEPLSFAESPVATLGTKPAPLICVHVEAMAIDGG